MLYNYYCKTIPKSRTFFRYIKPKKSNINKDLLNILSKHLQLSKREIKDNYNLIGKDFKIELLTNLNIDNNQIKKLLK